MNNKAPSSAPQQAGKSTARTVHRMSGAHGHTTLMQEHADLQARYEEQMVRCYAFACLTSEAKLNISLSCDFPLLTGKLSSST